MGQTVDCVARWGGQTSRGTAQLEHDRLIFRGDVRLTVLFHRVKAARRVGQTLVIDLDTGSLRLRIGSVSAERWTQAILHPKTRMQKLGVRRGAAIAAIGPLPGTFVDELKVVGETVTTRLAGRCDAIFLAATDVNDLAALADIAAHLQPAGALWIVRPKGRPEISEAAVMAAGKAAGLVDVKVVRFSETHTAEKFVIPVERRGTGAHRPVPGSTGSRSGMPGRAPSGTAPSPRSSSAPSPRAASVPTRSAGTSPRSERRSTGISRKQAGPAR